MKSVQIEIKGTVQGVGFRPFVYRTAQKYGIKGVVLNNPLGVLVKAEGVPAKLDDFVKCLRREAPSVSKISELNLKPLPLQGFRSFQIEESEYLKSKEAEVTPDLAICPDCLSELESSSNKRFQYPFINCTNCGPRFSIIKDIPYDRLNTTMAKFKMCKFCQKEYQNPSDRRFHAEPNACPNCGPKISLEDNTSELVQRKTIEKVVSLLRQGKIVAVKGIGGFHLACDATNEKAVKLLRQRKYREDKPFALMALLEQITNYCYISQKEKSLLLSAERPIVLLRKKFSEELAESIAPKQKHLGFMTPYSPLHYLICKMFKKPLVMTSANITDEPIAFKNKEAKSRLSKIADHFLFHNRPIETRLDDSVVRVLRDKVISVRRSRGYAPRVIKLPLAVKQSTLALGAGLKNTFCLAKGNRAYLSHHIGDLENYQTLNALKKGIAQYEHLFDVIPQRVVCDKHPEYLSSKIAEDFDLPLIKVQHHFAHLAACLLDNEINDKVIGVAFDGLGYGDDGKFWGGEAMIADLKSYRRVLHLEEVAMPGGELAIKQPWRMATSYLLKSGLNLDKIIPLLGIEKKKLAAITQIIERDLNCPKTTSIGRLFDGISALLGICLRANYEGQPAIELEMIADEKEKQSYPLNIEGGQVKIRPLVASVLADLKKGAKSKTVSSKFHNWVSQLIIEACLKLRDKHSLDKVALSGGVFQNQLLLERVVKQLERANFKAYYHHEVPTNDGGISLGQVAVCLGVDN